MDKRKHVVYSKPKKTGKPRMYKTKYICPRCGCNDGDNIEKMRIDFYYCRKCGCEFDTDMIQEGM